MGTLVLSPALLSEEAISGKSHVTKKGQEGNPDSNELHKVTSALLRNFPLGPYTGPKVAVLSGAFMPTLWDRFRQNSHLC